MARTLEMQPLEARCHLGLAVAHHADGRIDEACAAQRDATAMFRRMGMEFWLSQAQRLQFGGEHAGSRE